MGVDRFTSGGSVILGEHNSERWHPPASGSAVSTNIDAGARALIAQLLATPGTTPDIESGDGISADGKQWQNQTGAPIPVPSPALTADMLTAGFTDVTQGGATDSLNTVGPWAGAANAGDKFGLDPASGDRYFVDAAGDWQPLPSGTDLNTTREVVAGPAPAVDIIPTEVSSQTRDDGDYHVITFDDYRVAYQFGAPNIEISRQSMTDGGFESITLTAPATLSENTKANWLREYIITATTPITQVTVDGDITPTDVVEFTLSAPTADDQRINAIRRSSEHIYLNGPANGQTGLVVNRNNAEVKLRSSGGSWWMVT